MKKLLLIFVLLTTLPVQASSVVPEIVSLGDVSFIAKKNNLPIMVAFFDPSCPYCKIAEENVIEPLINDPNMRGKIIIVKANVYNTDLDKRFNITTVPTLVFINYRGKELAERIVGVPTLDFYAGMVDNAINTSICRLGRRSCIRSSR